MRIPNECCVPLTPIFAGFAATVCVIAAIIQPGVRAAWALREVPLALIAVLFLATAVTLIRSVGGLSDGRPFFLGLALFGLGVVGFGITVFPDIVPFRMSLWAAASSTLSHVFLLIGAAVVTPVVLAYSAFAYRVFRGKTPAHGWEV